MPGTNMNIKWSADMTTQIINGNSDLTPSIERWRHGTLLTAEGTRTNNGTKGNPALVADIFGDWREELVVRTTDSSALRIYLSTEVTDRKLYTLMHDPQYRVEVARQNTTYNQPSYTSFYFASDTDFSAVPVPYYQSPGMLDLLENRVSEYALSGELTNPLHSRLTHSLKQAKFHMSKGSRGQALKFMNTFIAQLEEMKKPGTISNKARLNLSYQAHALMGWWK